MVVESDNQYKNCATIYVIESLKVSGVFNTSCKLSFNNKITSEYSACIHAECKILILEYVMLY
jgi:hypothetical protein